MTDTKRDDEVQSFVRDRDAVAESFFNKFQGNPAEIKGLIDNTPTNMHIVPDSFLTQGLKWQPRIELSRGTGRPLVELFDLDYIALGARKLKAAMNFTSTDQSNKRVFVFYPEFSNDGQINFKKSHVLNFSESQADSLEKLLKGI